MSLQHSVMSLCIYCQFTLIGEIRLNRTDHYCYYYYTIIMTIIITTVRQIYQQEQQDWLQKDQPEDEDQRPNRTRRPKKK